jgi:hypothetical protein
MENVLNGLKESFGYISFQRYNHSYINTLTKKRFNKSVTQYLSEFKKPFDSAYWSKKKAKERGVHPQIILNEWAEKGERTARNGTKFHAMVEQRLKNNNIVTEGVSEKLVKMFNTYYDNSSTNLVPICSELILGDKELDVAGSCDQLYWSKKLDGLVLFDWKTNEKIEKENVFQKMLFPYQDLDDCAFNNYSFQLNFYRLLIERNTSLKILNCYIGWFTELNETYQILKCMDMQDRLKKNVVKKDSIDQITLF